MHDVFRVPAVVETLLSAVLRTSWGPFMILDKEEI